MKATGIVRQVDPLGRIVLPKETRDMLDIKSKDGMEIFLDGDSIVLRRYAASCVFCSEASNIQEFHGKRICSACLLEIKNL